MHILWLNLLPDEYHSDCLYDTPADLVARLHHALLHCTELHRRNWRTMAAPFDWHLMASRYDAALEQVHLLAKNA